MSFMPEDRTNLDNQEVHQSEQPLRTGHWHEAVFPPRLVYPISSIQCSVRAVPCTTGRAGTGTMSFHGKSVARQSLSVSFELKFG